MSDSVAAASSDGNASCSTNAQEGKLFVGQVPAVCTEDMLRPVFQPFGTLIEIKIMRDANSGRSKGCAWVRFETVAQAQAAIAALNEIHTIPPQTNPLQIRLAEHRAFVPHTNNNSSNQSQTQQQGQKQQRTNNANNMNAQGPPPQQQQQQQQRINQNNPQLRQHHNPNTMAGSQLQQQHQQQPPGYGSNNSNNSSSSNQGHQRNYQNQNNNNFNNSRSGNSSGNMNRGNNNNNSNSNFGAFGGAGAGMMINPALGGIGVGVGGHNTTSGYATDPATAKTNGWRGGGHREGVRQGGTAPQGGERIAALEGTWRLPIRCSGSRSARAGVV